jgi:hypothetical protein
LENQGRDFGPAGVGRRFTPEHSRLIGIKTAEISRFFGQGPQSCPECGKQHSAGRGAALYSTAESKQFRGSRQLPEPGQTGSTAMSSDLHHSPTRVTVEHFLAGLTVWAVLMVVFVIL